MLKLQKATKTYNTGGIKFYALKEVDLKLEQGEIGVILGPSGSGKSTLMNIIGGIDQANTGEIKVDGKDIGGWNDRQLTEYRREMIGFVFQSYNLIPNLTVAENVETASHIGEKPIEVNEALNAVSMLELKHRFPRELSGGQQQRTAIARAIVKNPKLLLCDEPTGALDYDTSKDILRLLERLNQEFGMTMLIITHNAALADMAHRVFKMRSGELIESTMNETRLPAERIEW